MELEEAIKTLENFKNNKLEHDKLEIRYHGGFKIGDIYKFTELNPATETVLNHLTKQEKMIELMALAISSYDGQLVINQYKDRNEVKAKFEEYVEDGTYEQYFEKKAEDLIE